MSNLNVNGLLECKILKVDGYDVDYVIDKGFVTYGTSGQNGYYWYRYKIYKSGKVEMIGRYYTNQNTDITINFEKPLPTPNYVVAIQGERANSGYTNEAYVKSRTATSMTLGCTSAAQNWLFALTSLIDV